MGRCFSFVLDMGATKTTAATIDQAATITPTAASTVVVLHSQE